MKSKNNSDVSAVSDNILEDDTSQNSDGVSKTASKLLVFQEKRNEDTQATVATPESSKKVK